MSSEEKIPPHLTFLAFLGVAIGTLAMILKVVGGLACLFLMLHGVYALFAISIGRGFMEIGAAVVLAFVIQLGTGLLLGFSMWIFPRE